MIYRVNGIYIVEFLNPTDMDGNGLSQERHSVGGSIEAENETDARTKIEQAISERHFGCWRTEVTKLELTAEPKAYVYLKE